MSNIYNLEPPTKGKAILHTTFGEVDIEFWPREAPKAVRNFVQLALEGYYDDTVFHRIIPDFMVQGGDPTGTGDGGESIYGKAFKDEIHSRLTFKRRGMLAMANPNRANRNLSQFFLTLAPCDWLDGKHTIFGKVSGKTLFNLIRLATATEVDGSDRPMGPMPRIQRIEILSLPFDDITARPIVHAHRAAALEAERRAETDRAKAAALAESLKARRAVKNKKLLSFGNADDSDEDEDEAGGPAAAARQGKAARRRPTLLSAADAAKAAKRRRKAMKRGEPLPKRAQARAESDSAGSSSDSDGEPSRRVASRQAEAAARREASRRRRRRADSEDSDVRPKPPAAHHQAAAAEGSGEVDLALVPPVSTAPAVDKATSGKAARLAAVRAEQASLRQRLERRKEPALASKPAAAVELKASAESGRSVLSAAQQRREAYKRRSQRHGRREDDTLARLAAFTSKLRGAADPDEQRHGGGKSQRAGATHYSGQVLEADERAADEADTGTGWMRAKLQFKRHVDDAARDGDDGLVTIDPKASRGRDRGDGEQASGRGGGPGRRRGDRDRGRQW